MDSDSTEEDKDSNVNALAEDVIQTNSFGLDDRDLLSVEFEREANSIGTWTFHDCYFLIY